MNTLLVEHKSRNTSPDELASTRTFADPHDEFSLDGLPTGSADDLIGFAEQFGGLRRER